MHNSALAEDYLTRATNRLAALDVLFDRKSWADVVRESQEVVELALKSLLRYCSIEVPRVHDVGQVLRSESEKLPEVIRSDIEELAEISRSLRRDRELAFYGSEDLTPSDFYRKSDAEMARAGSRRVVEAVTTAVRQ
jgi:HEPN domain-containing protein